MRAMMSFIFLVSSFLNVHAQSLFGTYTNKSEDQLSAVTTISFFRNKTFSQTIKTDMGTQIGKGKFKKQGNSLILSYDNQVSADTSEYQLANVDIENNSVSRIDLKVFDMKTNTPLMATYGCRDNEGNIIFHHLTDVKGTGNITLYSHKAVKFFTIDALGYQRISIPVARLTAKSTTITAYLRQDDVTYIDQHQKKISIKELNDKVLVVKWNYETIRFEKIINEID